MPQVLKQEWLESERGWGTRPDGYSLHTNDKTLKAYVDDHNASLPENPPDIYSRVTGRPHWVEVSEELFQEVIAGGNGIKRYANHNTKNADVEHEIHFPQATKRHGDLV